MARFYFDLHECGSVTPDPEGREFVSLDAAREAAKHDARAIMCEELGNGCLCLSCLIEIQDAGHAPIERLLFKDAVHVTGA